MKRAPYGLAVRDPRQGALLAVPRSRPTVRLDADTGTLILGQRSPLKGRYSMVNPPNPRGLVVTAAAARRDPNALYAYLRQQGQTVTAAKRAVLRAFPRAVAHKSNPQENVLPAFALQDRFRKGIDYARAGVPLSRAMDAERVYVRHPELREAFCQGYRTIKANPLTRAETAAVLREARRYGQQGTQQRHVAAARREPFATWRESAARSQGAAEAVRRLALRFGPHSRRGNPPPRVLGAIPGRMTRIEYRRAGPNAGRYYHNFQPASDVRAWALSDGSVILAGRRPLVVRQ